MAPSPPDVNGVLGISEKLAYRTKKDRKRWAKQHLQSIADSVFRLTPAVQQGSGHPAAAVHQIEALFVDAPLEQHAAVERHQIGHQLLRVAQGGDTALLLAGGGQLPQDAEIDAGVVVPQNGLLRVLQPVNKAAVQGGLCS